jgi:thiamine-phosphate pyrophosphorylase
VPLPRPIRDSSRLLCYVTDRAQISNSARNARASLLDKIKSISESRIDFIQIREKDLSGRELSELAREVIRLVPHSCRILINDRLDVAQAVAAAGVHLGEKSIPVEHARRYVEERGGSTDFLIGVSAHSPEAARSAQMAGADYVIFGPVFVTPSKAAFGPAQGLEKLATVCASVSIPVLAIGGITQENASECYSRGASGIAAIRLFQEAADAERVVKQLRGLPIDG